MPLGSCGYYFFFLINIQEKLYNLFKHMIWYHQNVHVMQSDVNNEW